MVKKKISKSDILDTLTTEHKTRPRQCDKSEAHHADAAKSDTSTPHTSLATSGVDPSATKSQGNVRTRREGIMPKQSRVGKNDESNDASYATVDDNSSNCSIKKLKPKRGRPKKKQQSQKPEETLESLRDELGKIQKLRQQSKI